MSARAEPIVRRDWGDDTSTVLVVRTEDTSKHPETIEGLMRGPMNAINFICPRNAGAQKAISDAINNFTSKRPSVTDLFRGPSRTRVTADLNLNTLAEYALLNKEAGFAREVPDLSTLVDLSLVRSLSEEDSPENRCSVVWGRLHRPWP